MRNLSFILVFFIIGCSSSIITPTYPGTVEDYYDILDKKSINSVLAVCDSLKIGTPDIIKSEICVRGLDFNAYCIRTIKKIEIDSISFERRRLFIYISGNSWSPHKYNNLDSSKIEVENLFTDRSKYAVDTLFTYKLGISDYDFRIDDIDYKTAVKILEAFLKLREESDMPIDDLRYLVCISKSYKKENNNFIISFSYKTRGKLYFVKFENEKLTLIETKNWII